MNWLASPGWRMGLVLALAYLLTLLPGPALFVGLKPFWLGLLVIWLALEHPARGPLGFVFLVGLGADLLLGTWFGEHALRLLVIAFIVRRFRSRLRFFPLWQQSLAVGALLLNDRVVIVMLRSFVSPMVPEWSFWLPALSGMLLWPLLFLVVDDLGRRLRSRPDR